LKSLQLEGKRLLKLREIQEPEVNIDNTVISVEATGVGGSEYLGFNNPGIRSLPSVMGHGFSGTTPDGRHVAIYPLTGCGACGYCATGQIQLCDNWSLIGVQSNGGFSQRVSVPKEQLVEIPANLSWEKSVFIEPFANSINAWQLSKASDQESVAIVGSGGLGLGLVACAHKAGCKEIHVAELSKNRRNAAVSLGATFTKNALYNTYDIVFDTVGSVETRAHALQITKKGGKCVFLGFETPEVTINMSEVIRHQKTLIGSFVFSKQQFSEAIKLVENCDNSWVKGLNFEQIEDHLIRFLNGDFSCIKLALRPNA